MVDCGPTVSVVIPAYNCTDTISHTIESVLEQTVTDLEVVVVDDGSTDRTPAIVEEIPDPRVRLHQHEENQGRSAARNTGVTVSEGEFIAYVDSDDRWHPEKLEKQVQCLCQRSDDWIGVYCDSRYEWSNIFVQILSDRIHRPTGKEGGEELISDVLTSQLAINSGSTLLIRAQAASEIGEWSESLHRFEDLGYITQLLAVGKLAYIDEELVSVYDSGKSGAATVVSESKKFRNIYESFISSVESGGVPVTKYHQFMISKHYFSSGNFVNGIQSLWGSKYPHGRDLLGLVKSIGEGFSSKIRKLSGGK
jgi:glycosyltransferase involved in cell wall biosynthesis